MSKVKFNTRFFCLLLAVICILGIIPSTTVSALDYSTGRCAQIKQSAEVYDDHYNVIGTVDPGEGVTIISSSSIGFYIEYNTFDGPMQGHIKSQYALVNISSAYGVVTTSSNTYYAPNRYHYAGSVSVGENIGVLCDNGSWAYIEYNVSNANRKRAFIPSSCITYYSQPESRFYHETNIDKNSVNVTSNITVYSGPNAATYEPCGTIYSSDKGKVYSYRSYTDKDGDLMYYVSYPGSGNVTKYGYIYA